MPLRIQINLDESPGSPPQESLSPIPPQPIPVQELSPGSALPDDGNNFLNCFTCHDVLYLKTWALETKGRINEEAYVMEAPVKSQIFLVFLRENRGQQWEIKFLRPAAGTLFEQMISYVVGYARLTSQNKHLLRGLYETWSVEKRA